MATPAERGEFRSINALAGKVPTSAVIRNQGLTRRGSNFLEWPTPKKKVAGRVAALSDDKQKFIAQSDYQNPLNPASAGWEVQA
jgi:hypothetical protein